MKIIYRAFVFIFACFVCSACQSHSEEETAHNSDFDLTSGITDYLDSVDYEYGVDKDTDDGSEIVHFVIHGEQETIRTLIFVYPDENLYQIICWSTDKQLSEESRSDGMIAANGFNSSSTTVCCFIDKNGRIAFRVGCNTDGNAFSKEAFVANFIHVLDAADEDTARIYLKATESPHD